MAKSISRRLADSASPTGAIDGTLSTAAQTNITSVGTLSSLAVSGTLTVDTNTLVVDSTNNRVGIGVTPTSRLHLKVAGNTYAGGIQIEDADSLTKSAITHINSSLYISAAGTNDDLIIDSSGNVGIGTTSPNSYSGYTALTLNHATNGGLLDFELNGNLQGEIYSNSANLGLGLQAVGNRSIELQTNGTLRATIDGSGNVGIGPAPSAWHNTYNGALQLKGGSLFTATSQTYLTHNLVYTTDWKAINTSASSAYLQSAGAHQWFTFASASAGATASPTSKMILSADGGLGLGTTDATDTAWGSAANNTEFAIDGNAGYGVIHLRGTGTGSTSTRYSIGCGDSKFYLAYDDVAAVHRIQVHGTEVEITNSSTNYALKIKTPHGFAQIGALNSTYLHNETDRSINYWSKRCEASGGFHTYSDERLKENITPIDSALSKVEQMNGVTFTWIDPARGGGDTGKQFGVIAQNMAAIDSELPSLNPDPLETDENINDASKDTDYYTMDYSRITPFLIEAIKELKEELNTATARISELENN